MATTKITLNAAGWTAIASGSSQDVMVQLQGNGPVLLNYAAADPGAGTVHGIRLEIGKLETLTFTSLADNIYGRVPLGGDNTTVVVMET